MTANSNKIICYILLVSITIFPSLFFYSYGSMSHGLLLFSVLSIFLTYNLSKKKLSKELIELFIKISLFSILFVIIHYCISFIFFINSNEIRFLYSIVSAFMIFLSSALFGIYLIQLESLNLLKIIFKIFYFFLIFLSILTFIRFSPLSPVYLTTNIYITIFSEPSHFATTMLPFITFYSLSINGKLKKIANIIFFIILALSIKNLTLLIGMALIFIATFEFKQVMKLLFFTFLILIIFSLINFIINNPGNNLFQSDYFRYFVERINLKTNLDNSLKVNMSVLVFFAGHHEMLLNLLYSNFFGVGFQQFGIVGVQSHIRDLIFINSGYFEFTHNKDASFLIGKLISEFGFFGLIFLAFYIKIFIKNFLLIKNFFLKERNILHLFASSCIISFSIELFIRGSGYFTVSSYLFLVSLLIQKIYILYDKKKS